MPHGGFTVCAEKDQLTVSHGSVIKQAIAVMRRSRQASVEALGIGPAAWAVLSAC